MANLLGQNIGTNYKGILNLNTLNGNLSGTLQAVTDGDGNASPLQLSTSQVSNVFASSHTVLWRANATLTDYSGWHQTDGTFVILKKDASPLWINIDSAVNFSNGFGSTGRSSINAAGNWTIGGGFTNSARLHVRGDGTNPIARFENSSGTMLFGVFNDLNLQLGAGNVTFGATSDSSAYSSSGNGFLFRSNVTVSPGLHAFTIRNINTISATGSTLGGILLDMGTFAAAAGSANLRPLNIAYTINNSGVQTGNATGIFLNATETALNSMTHDLINLQVGGVSRFKVDSSGSATFVGPGGVVTGFGFVADGVSPGYFRWANRSRMASNADSTITLTNSANNNFDRLQFGGTTNAFPAIKRNGTGIDFRLADDTAFCSISINSLDAAGNLQLGASGNIRFAGITKIQSPAAGVITLGNDAVTDFGRLQFGGTTSSFPALKRNAAALDVKLADDTDFANLGAKEISASVGFFAPNSTEVRGNYIRGRSSTYMNFSSGTPGVVIDSSGTSSASASAILQADSTTKGFLPPRMTTAQRDSIATPATGLVIYNTTTNVLNFYNGTAWGAV